MINSFIKGVGHYVPERVVTNFDLAKVMDTNDEWIQERTGIVERRHIDPGTATSTDLGVLAAKNALKDAGLTAHDIDFILFATLLANCSSSRSDSLGVIGLNSSCWEKRSARD